MRVRGGATRRHGTPQLKDPGCIGRSQCVPPLIPGSPSLVEVARHARAEEYGRISDAFEAVGKTKTPRSRCSGSPRHEQARGEKTREERRAERW